MVERILICCGVCIALPFIGSALCGAYINRVYRGYLGTKTSLGISSNELIAQAAQEQGFLLFVEADTYRIRPALTDHYGGATVYLSHYNYCSEDVAALAVAAHEFGHAVQDFKADRRFVLRSSLIAQPTLGFALGFLVLLLGAMLRNSGVFIGGAAVWTLALAVDINTLKNEYDASRIARELLEAKGMPPDELALCDHIWQICAHSYLVAIFKHMAAAILILALLVGSKGK